MARNSGGGTATKNPIDAATKDAVSTLQKFAQDRVNAAAAKQREIAQAQTELDAAIAQAQEANDKLQALGSDVVSLDGIGVSVRKRPGRPRKNGGKGRGAPRGKRGANARSQNPHSLQDSILIAMSDYRVSTPWHTSEIAEALQAGGYKSSASDASFNSALSQALGKLIDQKFVEKGGDGPRSGIYLLTTAGKNAVKGKSLSDSMEEAAAE